MTLLSRALLFLSAFLPLWVVWALRAWPSSILWLFVALFVGGIVGGAVVLWAAYKQEGESSHVTDVVPRQSDIAAYLVTYLVPFVAVPTASLTDWAVAALFVGLIFLVYLQTDLIAFNPFLPIFRPGIRLYRVELDDHGLAWLLSDIRPAVGVDLDLAQLVDGVFIALRSA